MKDRLLFILRLYITLILLFVTQKIVFMLVNMGHAEGAPFGRCVAALWHGIGLDSVAACYIVAVPLVVCVVSCFFKSFKLRRVLKPYFVVSAILIAVVFIADTVLYFFWGAKLDASELMYVTEPKDIFANVKWWSIVVWVAALALLVWHYYRRQCHTVPEKLKPLRNRWSTLVFIPVAALLFLGMRGSVSQSTANPSFAYHSRYAFCNHAALNPFFNMFHSIFKAEDLADEFVFMPDNEAEALAAPLFATDTLLDDTLLYTQRPEILIIVWEGGGWQMTMADSVAPNLNRFGEEGVLFTQCYANSFRTDRGIVSLFSGWLGLPTTSLMKKADVCRKLPGLAKALRGVGYESSFYYGGDPDFTNMKGYLYESGFDNVYGEEIFPSSKSESNWGAPDQYTLLPSVVGRPRGGEAQGKPHMDVVLTLSSHEPWTVPMARFDDMRKNAFAYTDSCIGVLVDSLRGTPEWDNLLVIIIPDHGVPQSSMQSTSDPQVAHIPMVWTGGAVRRHVCVDRMMNQSDLAATLLAQMGVRSDDFVFSRNIMSPSYDDGRGVAFHAFKNGVNVFDTGGVARFDCVERASSVMSGSPAEDYDLRLKAMLQNLYQTTAKLR